MESSKKQNRTLDMAYIAIGAGLIAVCSWITVPMTVPFTFQTFAVFFLLSVLGGYRGTASVIIYILLGAVGLPVFSGFQGGIGTLLGTTGGYIIGFLFMGILYIAVTQGFGDRFLTECIALLIGLLVCYAFGTAWFLRVYTKSKGTVGIMTVLSWCVFPFILPDLLKMALALFISRRIKPLRDILKL